MNKFLEITLFVFAAISGSFFEEFLYKTFMSTTPLLIGTTLAYFWKKYLDKKE